MEKAWPPTEKEGWKAAWRSFQGIKSGELDWNQEAWVCGSFHCWGGHTLSYLGARAPETGNGLEDWILPDGRAMPPDAALWGALRLGRENYWRDYWRFSRARHADASLDDIFGALLALSPAEYVPEEYRDA